MILDHCIRVTLAKTSISGYTPTFPVNTVAIPGLIKQLGDSKGAMVSFEMGMEVFEWIQFAGNELWVIL